MADVQIQTQTPARRRRNPPLSNKRGQKAYASENDAATLAAARQHHGPQTPQKHNGNDENSKQRSHKQGRRSKNAPSSPESSHARQDRHTTPQHFSSGSKPVMEPAFAGATFHASPSPASLPMPSFLSRLAVDSPSTPTGQEPTPPASEIPTPQRPKSEARQSGSPLDFMFRAHREEQESKRRESPLGSASNLSAASPPIHSPTKKTESPQFLSAGSGQRRPATTRSRSFFDGSEQDNGLNGGATGPAFSTPYQERIRAARADNGRNMTQPPAQEPDPTEALKKFLFGGMNSGNAINPPRPLDASGTHAAPPKDGPPRTQNIQAMENDLRRILKMEDTIVGSKPHGQFSP